ncbi:MAG: hypothetical protein NTY02_16620 [Acidobacteria bacterium]|nr:hypothetical protein [Acidobacteriota bacterium]
MRRPWMVTGTACLVVAMAVGLSADVKSRQKTQVKFEGMLGRMMGMFGGKAAKEGIVSTVAVKGDRQMSVSDQTGELVDLAAEKVFQINFKDRSYKVRTFAEIRKEWEEAQAKMKEQASKEKDKEKSGAPEYEVDFDVKKTGQQKAVNGYACQEVIMTITIRQKGKKLEDGGGMVMTSDMWMAPAIPALQEQAAFQRRYIQKLYGSDGSDMARDMAQAMAMYPQMKDGLARMQKESVKLEGSPVLTTVVMESVQTPEQAQARADQEKSGGSGGLVGGLGGMFGKKKKADEPKDAPPPASAGGPKNRATIMTSTFEVLSVETAVAPADIDLPAGFKQK